LAGPSAPPARLLVRPDTGVDASRDDDASRDGHGSRDGDGEGVGA